VYSVHCACAESNYRIYVTLLSLLLRTNQFIGNQTNQCTGLHNMHIYDASEPEPLSRVAKFYSFCRLRRTSPIGAYVKPIHYRPTRFRRPRPPGIPNQKPQPLPIK